MAPIRRLQLGLVLMLGVAAASCAARSINDVLADPSRYRNQTVTVRGTVAESVSVVGRGAYRIVDGDQGLWVVTQSGAPRKGARVDVKGRVQDGYDLGAFGGILKLPGSLQSGLVLIEESHRARN
jgi:membrane protein implicated in regulation of membrane protease activity